MKPHLPENVRAEVRRVVEPCRSVGGVTRCSTHDSPGYFGEYCTATLLAIAHELRDERDRARDTAARLEAELARGHRIVAPDITLTRAVDPIARHGCRRSGAVAVSAPDSLVAPLLIDPFDDFRCRRGDLVVHQFAFWSRISPVFGSTPGASRCPRPSCPSTGRTGLPGWRSGGTTTPTA